MPTSTERLMQRASLALVAVIMEAKLRLEHVHLSFAGRATRVSARAVYRPRWESTSHFDGSSPVTTTTVTVVALRAGRL